MHTTWIGVGAIALAPLTLTLPVQALADSGHQHGHEAFSTQSEPYTHGAETGNVRSGDNIIEIYGKVFASAALLDDTENSPSWKLTSDGSRLGIRGNKALDESKKVFWQIESGIDLDNGDSEWHHAQNESMLASYDSFLGITHKNYGTILMGKHSTPYKLAVHSWDPFNHVAGDLRAILGHVPGVDSGTDHHGNLVHIRAPNTVMAMTPTVSGFSASLAWIVADESSHANVDPAYSMSLEYKNGPLNLVFASQVQQQLDGYAYDDDIDPNTPDLVDPLDTTASLVGAMYHTGGTMLSAIYERLNVKGAVYGDHARNALHLAAQHTFGADSVRLAVAKAGDMAGEDGGRMLAIGWFHNLSDATQAYTAYVKTVNDAEADFGTFLTNHMHHGEDASTLAVGLIHKF